MQRRAESDWKPTDNRQFSVETIREMVRKCGVESTFHEYVGPHKQLSFLCGCGEKHGQVTWANLWYNMSKKGTFRSLFVAEIAPKHFYARTRSVPKQQTISSYDRNIFVPLSRPCLRDGDLSWWENSRASPNKFRMSAGDALRHEKRGRRRYSTKFEKIPRGGRLRRYSVSVPLSGSSAGWVHSVSLSGPHAGRALARPE
jgi:hypothetical protein